ncbi:3-hydroxyacyl-CoA dehydrogenase [Sphingobium subterraneum]|uniref:3-hydroxybutyryl-CoA dehydrogenase n=1 Tax=Sphingobium subterraneum TaxID=627688 RepID=A0A841IXG3_9SPHN|nr:3-hydroxyacyl-CoA dehydrogenase [Sphingobium subterraneum]MBB6123353.1 3-hydroxybutyryl-CoA dehydrogenase [Sphingobium subterraneum]
MKAAAVIGVVGAGAMGSGIAQTALAAGLDVALFDQQPGAVEAAAERIFARLTSEGEKGRLAPDVVDRAPEKLTKASSLADLHAADLVVEAIIERLDAKQALFVALEAIVSSACVLATNTSSLSIAAIARGCARPERVCGMHFFNPVPVMRLVEIVRGPATNPETLQIAHAAAKRFGKVAIDVADAPGFLVNLGGRAYYTEALHLLQESAADAPTIDAIMRNACGFRMGPFELMDLTGIDVNFPVTKLIFEGYQGEPRLKTTYLHQLMVEAGRYGRKTGRGFYAYGDGDQRSVSAPQADDLRSVSFTADDRLGAGLGSILQGYGLTPTRDPDRPILIEVFGEDAATVAIRDGLDPDRVVAMDATGVDRGTLTIMAPLGAADVLEETRAWLATIGYTVHVIADTPGFVAPRMLAMIANLGCEIAQMSLASPDDIDRAMELGLNYPAGPLAIADRMGLPTVHRILTNLQDITGADRYRPSLWLRQRAMLGMSAKVAR